MTSDSPSFVNRYILPQTSPRYFLSWEMLKMAPGNSASIRRITGADRAEKFRVGSSRINTLAPDRLIFSSSTFAFWPPDSSAMEWSISSAVYFREPRKVRMRVVSSLSPDMARYSTGVISRCSRSS